MSCNTAHEISISIMDLAPDLVITKNVRTTCDSGSLKIALFDARLFLKLIPFFARRDPLPETFFRIKKSIVQSQRRKNTIRSRFIKPLSGKPFDKRPKRNEIQITVRNGILFIIETRLSDLVDSF